MFNVELYDGWKFGDNNRFMIRRFDKKQFREDYFRMYGVEVIRRDYDDRDTVFVYDRQNKDKYGLDEVVFQEWLDKVDSFEQVVNILRRRFPESFQGLQLYLDSSLRLFQSQFGDGKYPLQPVVDGWIKEFFEVN